MAVALAVTALVVAVESPVWLLATSGQIECEVEKKEIGRPMEREETPEVVEEESLEDAENVAAYSASKTLDEISEEVPQDIKDKIIDLEAEQQEKLR